MVRASWSQTEASYGMLRLGLKRKYVRGVLRQWNKEKVGNIFENIQKAEEDLKIRELTFQESENIADLISLNQSHASYVRAMADEESFWK